MDEQSAAARLTWGEPYFDHFEKYLGPVSEGFRYAARPSRASLQILAYDDIFEGCRAFCSFGLSRYPEQVGGVAEVVLPIDEGWDAAPDLLHSVLISLIEYPIALRWGLALRFDKHSRGFGEKYDKAAFYFSIPFDVPDGFNEVICGDQRGAIYLACFISEAEYQYALAHGPEALEDLFEAQEVDVFTLRRPSAV